MIRYNVIMVFHHKEKTLLMVERSREPYKGLMNLPGGKIEDNESDMESAYRELQEETGIESAYIELKHMMGFTYYEDDCQVEVFVGKLKHAVTLVREVHDLHWMGTSEDLFDELRFAGEGNIGHMMAHVKINYPGML